MYVVTYLQSILYIWYYFGKMELLSSLGPLPKEIEFCHWKEMFGPKNKLCCDVFENARGLNQQICYMFFKIEDYMRKV